MSPLLQLHVRHLIARALLSVGTVLSFTAKPVSAEEPVAVFSQVFNGYKRVKLPDNTFKPEFYSFGEGGHLNRGINDPGMDKVKFIDVARIVATPLKNLNYLPASNASETELMILVFWGSTQGSADNRSSGSMDRAASASALYNNVKPQSQNERPSETAEVAQAELDSALWQMSLENATRDQIDARNARILGYTDAFGRAQFLSSTSMGQDILSELSINRFFVVLQAYDFRTAREHKKLKPLWTVRMSVSEQGDFAKAVQKMAWTAVRFYGEDSGGLRRHTVPEGKVELGPLEVIGVEQPK